MTARRYRTRNDEPVEELDEGRSDVSRTFRNWFFFFLALSCVTLLFGALVVRTAGFREIVAVKNLEWTQTRVSFRDSHVGWPYDIVLTGVAVPVKADEGNAALYIPEVRVGWRPWHGLEIQLVRPRVRLVQLGSGTYLPEELARIGDVRNAEDISDWLVLLKGRGTLRIHGACLEVVTPEGQPVRRLEGVCLDVSPVTLPGRSAVHFALSMGPMEGVEGRYLKLAQEWLVCGNSNVVEIAFAVEAGGKPWARDYWKGIQP